MVKIKKRKKRKHGGLTMLENQIKRKGKHIRGKFKGIFHRKSSKGKKEDRT